MLILMLAGTVLAAVGTTWLAVRVGNGPVRRNGPQAHR